MVDRYATFATEHLSAAGASDRIRKGGRHDRVVTSGTYGLLIMTCASLGRQQHGTRRAKPADLPLMTASGSDHYRNLTAADFLDRCAVARSFCWSSFFNDHVSRDFYFIGLGKALGQMVERAETFRNEFEFLLRRKNVFGEW